MSKSSAKEIAQHTSLTSPFRYYPSALPDLNLFFPPHWHNEFELNYIRSGRAVFYYTIITVFASQRKREIFSFFSRTRRTA